MDDTVNHKETNTRSGADPWKAWTRWSGIFSLAYWNRTSVFWGQLTCKKKKTVQLLYNLARTSKLREIVKDGRAGRAAVHGVAKSRIRLRKGTTATNCRRHCTYWHSSKLSNTFCVVVINPVFSFLHAFWGQYTQGWSGSGGSLRASQVALVVKNPPADAGDKRHAGSIPGSGRSPGGGHGSPLQCSCLENPMHRRAWWATVHGVAKSQTRLNRWSTHAGNLKSNTMEI